MEVVSSACCIHCCSTGVPSRVGGWSRIQGQQPAHPIGAEAAGTEISLEGYQPPSSRITRLSTAPHQVLPERHVATGIGSGYEA